MAHIPVGSSEGGVSQLLLDDRYRYTFGHQFICVGVPETVRVDTLLNGSLVGEAPLPIGKGKAPHTRHTPRCTRP